MASKKLVRKASQPSLKSQGAGASTTNTKTGVTTYYKSAKDQAGYSDTNQSRSNQSKGTPMSAFDKTGKAISVNQLGTTSPVIPPAPGVQDVGNMLGVNNASVLQEGLTLDGGQFVKDPNASDQMNATKEANAGLGNTANAILSYLKPEQDQAANLYRDTYGISDKQAGRDFRNAQQEVQQYTSQLNEITASRDAAMLSLEGQGRGQTGSFVGGEQARINREAAIQALPVQAQLAASQGNLEIAKSHVDTLFQMKVKDIETQQAYKTTVANTFMSVANAQQQNLLNAAIADSNARADMKKTAMNDAKSIAMQAIEYGQSSLARSVMNLDPTSPTYQQDVLKAMGQLSKPVVATGGTAKRDTQVVDGKLVDMQTGEVINNFANADNQQQEQLNETLTLARELLSNDTSGKSGAVGFGFQKFVPFGQSLGLQGDRTSFENKVNTLKANLTLDNLKLLKGPMSDKDLAFLQAIGSSLTTNMSEKSFNNEMTRIVNKLEEKVAPVSPYGTQIITAPDGLQIEIID